MSAERGRWMRGIAGRIAGAFLLLSAVCALLALPFLLTSGGRGHVEPPRSIAPTHSTVVVPDWTVSTQHAPATLASLALPAVAHLSFAVTLRPAARAQHRTHRAAHSKRVPHRRTHASKPTHRSPKHSPAIAVPVSAPT